MKLRSFRRAVRWAAVAALLVVTGCAADPVEPGEVATYCADPAWCVGSYPDDGLGLYDDAGLYPYYGGYGWWHGDHGFHHGWHPGFAHHDFAMHEGVHPGFGGFHPGFGGFHGGFAHIGMAGGHFGGGRG
jgi:hypothetical protein